MYKQDIQPIKMLNLLPEDKAKEFSLLVAQNPLMYYCPNLVQEQIVKSVVDAQKESPVSTCLLLL